MNDNFSKFVKIVSGNKIWENGNDGNPKAPHSKRKPVSLEQARKNYVHYSVKIADHVICFDSENKEEFLKLVEIARVLNWHCITIESTRGGHIYFFNRNQRIKGSSKKIKIALTFTMDILNGIGKNGKEHTQAATICIDKQERTILYFNPTESGELDEVPECFIPVKSSYEFFGMKEGEGRNSDFFRYILDLQREGFTKETGIEVLKIINQFIFKESIPEKEFQTVTRDEAWSKPIFFKNNKFQHDEFANVLRRENHIILINNNLHIYRNGIYVDDVRYIYEAMINLFPKINRNQRAEVLSYLQHSITDNTPLSKPNKIPVKNGLYNLDTDRLEEFTPAYISKNKIVTAYNPAAQSKVIDNFLKSLACNDESIKANILEMIGTCLYRDNSFDKFFILIGNGSNGKSTLLDLNRAMLGEENVSSVELERMENRFITAELFGKLVNQGDDISAKAIKNSAFIKKLASGNMINVERKGQNPFEMKSFAKMIFSANEAPIIHDISHGLNRRLVLIPLNYTFVENLNFKEEIMTQENLEYLLKLAIKALKQLLKNNGKFTASRAITMAKTNYQRLNNPIMGFLEEIDHKELLNESTDDVFLRFSSWCSRNNIKYEFQQKQFTSEALKITGFGLKKQRIPLNNSKSKIKTFWKIYVPQNEAGEQ